MSDKINEVLKTLESFGIEYQNHTGEGLVAHLKGTYEVLLKWNCSEDLCLAGLCHSVYGTESYKSQTVPLSARDTLKKTIGEKAENLAYLFGAHEKESLWKNLEAENGFSVKDRFTTLLVPISHDTLKDLLTLTLANWLEQRDRVPEEYKALRKDEFLKAENYLPEVAFIEFKRAYGI